MSIKEAQLSDPKPRAYSFGRFSLDLARACLYCDTQEVKLRPKSFQLLVYFVENPGRLITKQELMQALWPDSFVTDDSIVQCVKQIRRALQDDSQHHIKTVPRSGYIFDMPVSANAGANASKDDLQAEVLAESLPAAETIEDGLPQSVRLDEDRLIRGRRHLLIVAAFCCLAAVFGFIALDTSSNSAPPIWRGVPLTSYPGTERHPALSPDGSAVAFSWNGEKEDNFDIYILRIGDPDPPLRLTTNPVPDTSPAWSRDGRTVSFLRFEGARNQLVVVPAAGGPEHALAEVHNQKLGDSSNSHEKQAWSPDGHWIALAASASPGLPRGLLLISSITGEKRLVTQPPAYHRDHKPAFSPDGRTLVFVRREGLIGKLYLQALSNDYVPLGKPQPLTHEGSADDAVWTGDGLRILYTTGSEMKMISPSTAASQPVILEDRSVSELSLGRHLVYTTTIDDDADIYYADVPSAGRPPASPRRLIASTRHDQHPAFSPDGKRIAFVSERSGKRELWIANADGSNPVQRTSQVAVWFPSWSPNGTQIVFHGRTDGQATADLFTVPAAGGAMKRLTSDPADDHYPSYSQNGEWIYFNRTRLTRQSEIWRMPATGGEATRVTFRGGSLPVESPDGKTLFYVHDVPAKGIWKIPVQGGEAVQVTGPVRPFPAFAVSQHGIYYDVPQSSVIQFLEFSTGISRPVVVADRIVQRMSLSPDGKSLLFVQRDRPGSDLMLIRDFSM